MKQILVSAFLFLLFTNVNAQVKIGGTPVAPVPSAVLELDGGNNRGLLLPRMRKMDIDAIVNPAEGLTIYATDQQAVYLRRSGNWVKMNGDADAFSLPYTKSFSLPNSHVLWLTNNGSGGTAIQGVSDGNGYGVRGFTSTGMGTSGVSTDINGLGGYFLNSAGGRSLVSMNKTGIGTTSPDALLHVDGTTTTGSTIIIDDDDDPTIQFRKAGINKSFIKQQGNDLVFRPNADNSSGKVVLQSSNDGTWMFLDAAGDVSLGINPAGFNGTPLGSRMNIKDNAGINLTLDAPSDNLVGPSLSFVNKVGNNTTVLSKILANNLGLEITNPGVMTLNNGGNIILKKPGSFEHVMDIRVQSGFPVGDYADILLKGRMGIGSAFTYPFNGQPQATLDISTLVGSDADPHEAIRISGSNPIIRLTNGNSEKAFMQVVDNDFKVGTVATNNPGRYIIRTNGTDRLWVDSVGYVTIGGKIGPTLNGPYKLAVKGKIAATDFNVVATGSWPDYVFSPSYKLRSLEETEAYINEHKHLPNIPAAAVVDKEGFALGDMQKRMMEKVEELTLYLIEANKNIHRQQKEIDQLKNQVIVLQGNK